MIDEDGNFSVQFNAYNLKSATSLKTLDDDILVMKSYYGFNWKMLTRLGKNNNQEAIKIVNATFFPGITFTVFATKRMNHSELVFAIRASNRR